MIKKTESFFSVVQYEAKMPTLNISVQQSIRNAARTRQEKEKTFK